MIFANSDVFCFSFIFLHSYVQATRVPGKQLSFFPSWVVNLRSYCFSLVFLHTLSLSNSSPPPPPWKIASYLFALARSQTQKFFVSHLFSCTLMSRQLGCLENSYLFFPSWVVNLRSDCFSLVFLHTLSLSNSSPHGRQLAISLPWLDLQTQDHFVSYLFFCTLTSRQLGCLENSYLFFPSWVVNLRSYCFSLIFHWT